MKRFKLFRLLVLLFVISGYGWAFFTAPGTPLPDRKEPICLYSNQSRHNLLKLFEQAVGGAKSSLHLVMYALTDPTIVKLLSKKSSEGVKAKIFYDPSATPALALEGGMPIHVKGGLMHRKILVTDEERSFFGSANFTTTSLKMHDNLVAGLYHPELARFLMSPTSSNFSFSLGKTLGEAWLLPSSDALDRLIEKISHAKKKIYVAMFTFTHPLLAEALISAFKRGVDVRVALDHYTAEGASLPVVSALKSAGIPIFLSQGQQLFHHKWAWIDNSTLIFGSANWTRAAFSENQDCLMILEHLKFQHKKQMKKIWNIIEAESIN